MACQPKKHFQQLSIFIPLPAWAIVFCVIPRIAVLTYDGQTDRQTHDDSIYRASLSSRGKNHEEQNVGA